MEYLASERNITLGLSMLEVQFKNRSPMKRLCSSLTLYEQRLASEALCARRLFCPSKCSGWEDKQHYSFDGVIGVLKQHCPGLCAITVNIGRRSASSRMHSPSEQPPFCCCGLVRHKTTLPALSRGPAGSVEHESFSSSMPEGNDWAASQIKVSCTMYTMHYKLSLLDSSKLSSMQLTLSP